MPDTAFLTELRETAPRRPADERARDWFDRLQMAPKFLKFSPRDLRALLVAPSKEAVHA